MCVIVQGLYNVEVRLFGYIAKESHLNIIETLNDTLDITTPLTSLSWIFIYENPTQRCQGCREFRSGVRSCCDDFADMTNALKMTVNVTATSFIA